MQGFSGDDIMLGQGGFDKFLGELGFDWGSYEKETHGVDVDQNLRLFVPNANQPAGDAVRDFWTSTEGLSGSAFNDDLKGEAGGKIDPLNELANRLLQPENVTIVVVGDAAALKPQLERLGIPVTFLNEEGFELAE